MGIWRQFWISPDAHRVCADTLMQAQALQHAAAQAQQHAAPDAPGLRLLHAVCITPGNTPFAQRRQSLQGGQLLLSHYSGALAGVLKEIGGLADEIVLDAACLPSGLDAYTARALARCCRPGTQLHIRGQTAHKRALADTLKPAGFVATATAAGSAQAWVYSPHWPARRTRQPITQPMQPTPHGAITPGRCLVVGAGLAGAAVAASLARRGWQVCVLDAQAPASGASGVPAALLVPHTSRDNSVLSRISQAGVQATWAQVHSLLVQGADWQQTGVHQVAPAASTPTAATPLAAPGRRSNASAAPQWHASGGWVKPARLVHAWLAQPGIAVQAHCPVARLAPPDARQPQWRALDGAGHELARASLVVLAAGFASQALLQDLLRDAAADASRHASANSAALPACLPADPPADSSTGSSAGLSAYLAAPGALPWPSLQAIRGQVSWGAYAAAGALAHLLPATPVNGHGSWMAGVPAEPDVPAWPGVPAETGAASAAGRAELRWLCGASYQRDAQDLAPRPADHLANLARLPVLLPNTGALLAAQLAQTPTQAWVGVRCASRDRLPLVGAVPGMPGQNATAPGLWLCTALGSRGLSYAALCAELLAAWLHQEPLPLPATLARHLQAQRR